MMNILIKTISIGDKNFYPSWTFSQEKGTNIVIIKRNSVIVAKIKPDHILSKDEAMRVLCHNIKKYGDDIYESKLHKNTNYSQKRHMKY